MARNIVAFKSSKIESKQAHCADSQLYIATNMHSGLQGFEMDEGARDEMVQPLRVRLEILAGGVFAPVKMLELFAAIGCLPDDFLIRRDEAADSWVVTLTADSSPCTERVFAKIEALPGLLAFGRSHNSARNCHV
ncbi:hypothetical protein [Hyphomonas neptunium]|nr:hypothetical protein [Hyphomonas neptunium]